MTNVEDTTPSPGKAMTLRLDLVTWRALKLRALDEGRPAHELIMAALQRYLSALGD